MTRIHYLNKNEVNSNKLCIVVSCLCTAFLLLLVYCLRGIYPFGTFNVSYYDMSQSNIPGAYYVYDVLHGDSDMWLNWKMGAGTAVAEAIGNSVLSPFNLLFLFVSRSKILEAMSWFLLIKLCACAASMTFYSQRTFVRLGSFWHIVFGILYASGGFVLQYYTNIHFLDIVALFPLLIYFCDRLLVDEKVLGYILLMTLGLINNIQMMSMVCWFIVLYVSYPIRLMDKARRKRTAFLLGVSTVIALCMSACITLPVMAVLFQSGRSQLETNKVFEYLYGILVNQSKNAKLFMVYGTEIAVSSLLYCVLFMRKRIRELWKYLRMVIFLFIPIPFELVNRFWHIGGYVQFPMRFGYMLPFAGLALLGSILVLLEEQSEVKESVWRKYAGLFAIAGIPFLAVALFGFAKLFSQYGIRDDSSFRPYWSLLAIIVIVYFLALCAKERRIRYAVCGLAAILQFTIGWYGFLAPEEEASPECTDDIVYNGERLRDYLRVQGDDEYNHLNRVKDASVSMNANYGNIVGRASISSWSYGINPNLVPLLEHLGYNSNYIRTLDGGATVFSDAFFRMGSVVSYEKPDEKLYELKDTVDEYYISDAKYLYPFGVVVSENHLNTELANEETSAYQWQNALYQLVSGDSDFIMTSVFVDDFLKQESFDDQMNGYVYEYSIPVEDEAAVYLSPLKNNQYMFWVDDEQLSIHDLANAENTIYPGFFANGLISLGVRKNTTIELKICCPNPLEEENVELGFLSLNKLQDSIEFQNSFQRSVKVHSDGFSMEISGVDEGCYLLLPMDALDSFKLTINGRKGQTANPFCDALVMIALDEGENELELRYVPKGLYVGMVVSCVGLVLLGFLLKYKDAMLSWQWISSTVLYMYYLVFWGFVIIVYILPMLATIIVKIKYSGS